MSIFQHARAALVGVAVLTGSALAQRTPTTDPDTKNDPTMSDDTTRAPVEADADIDVNVNTPPAPQPAPVINTEPTYVSTPTTYEREETTLERYGIAVALGGGVEGFTDDTARTATDDGGSWNVRLALGTRSPIGFEAAYIGSAQGIDALGLDNDAILVGNGVEGKVRVNLLDANIQPFAFGGVGWRRYSLTRNDFNTSAISEEDDVLEIPLGAGIATKWMGFMFDARGEYRFATEEDLMPSLNGNSEAALHRWGINANVGYAF